MSMSDKEWYELVEHNFDNPDPGTDRVVDRVRGRGNAVRMQRVHTNEIPAERRAAGFGIHLRKCGGPPSAGRPRRRPHAGPRSPRRRDPR